MKKPLRWTLILLAIFVLLLVTTSLVIQTDSAKHFLARKLTQVLSASPGRKVQIEGISGRIPLDIRIKHVAVSDRNGPWLELQDARLKWSPSALLRGKIQVDQLHAAALTLDRFPTTPAKSAPRPTKKIAPLDLSQVPPVALSHLAIDRLRLGTDILGQEALFRLKGKLATLNQAAKIDASLDIERIDPGPHTSLRCLAKWNRADAILSLSLHFREQARGLVASLARFRDAGQIRLELLGKGPLSDWRGHLNGSMEQVGQIDSTIQLALTPDHAVTLNGSVRPAAQRIPQSLAPLLGPRQSFRVRVKTRDFRTLVVDTVELEGSSVRIALGGKVALDTKRFQTEVKVGVERLSLLQPLVGSRIGGRANLEGMFHGTFDAPEGSLKLHVSDGAWKEVELRSVNLEFRAGAEPGSTLSQPRYRLSSRGNLEIKRLPGKVVAPERRLNWQIDAKWLRGDLLKVEHLKLAGQHLRAEAKASLHLKQQTGSLDTRLNADSIRALAALAGQDLDGRLQVEVNAERVSTDKPYGITFVLHADRLNAAQVIPPELLGKSVDIEGHATFDPGHRIDIERLILNNGFLNAETKAGIDLDGKSLHGKLRLRLTDLAPVSALAGKTVSGSAVLDADVGGPWNDLVVRAHLQGGHLVYDGSAYDGARADLNVRGLPGDARGDGSVLLTMGKETLKAKTAFRYHEDRLALTGLSVVAPGCSVQGDLDIDVVRKRARGVLNGKLPDLGALGRLLAQDLAGNASFRTRLDDKGGDQDIELEMTAKGLRFSGLALEGLRVDGQIQGLLNNPNGRLQVKAQGFKSGEAQIRTLNAEVHGGARSLAYRLGLQGRYRSSLAVESAGSLSLADASKRIRIKEFQGHYGKIPLKLLQPLDLRFAPGQLAAQDLLLRVGTGRVQGSARWNSRKVAAHLGLSKMDLAVLEPFGIADIAGTCDLDARISGSSSRPSVTATVHLAGLRYHGPDTERLPPADVQINATVKAGRLNARLVLAGLSEQPLTATGSLPVSFAVKPAHFAIPSQEPVSGHVQGRIELGPAAKVFLPEDQVLSGTLTVEATAAGTAARPRFSGRLALAGGHYENLTSGTLLNEITGDIGLAADRLTIRQLTAATGDHGKVRVQGWLELAPERNFPLQVQTKLVRARLMQSDLASVSANGTLALRGSLQSMSAVGNLDLEPVEVRIPDQIGPSIPDLKVTEINKPGTAGQVKRKRGSSFKLALRIDLGFPQRLFVRGRGLDSEWHGRLKIRGTADRPVISGNLDFLRGHLNFLTKRMDLEDSTIQFTGHSPPDPILGIKAQSRADDTTIRILITGPASDPEIKMESDPSLPQDEILARLLFGKSVEKISPTQALQIALALKTLSGKGSMGLFDRTRNLLGVDSLDINAADGASSTIGIGKQLTDNLHVGYSTGTGHKKEGKVTVEMDVLPNLSVSSEISNRGNTGFGVNWKYDY